MNNNRAFSLKKYYLVFTVMFVIVSAGVLCYYYMNGRTLICSIDGWQQHYKALVYYGKYLRQIIRTVFSEHRLVIPAWDFTIAEGSDVVNTFHYYVMGDPLNLLSVLVPSRYTYILFDLLIVLREYLAGIAFSVMCFGLKKKNGYGVFAGAFSYMFCSWGIYYMSRHPFFLNPMIYFPLMILGVEMIIQKKKPVLMTIIVTVACASNFYFFYMLVILTVIYTVTRVIYLYRKNIGAIVMTILRVLAASCIGGMLAGLILLPVLYYFMNDTRLGQETVHLVLYPWHYYSSLPSVFLSGSESYSLVMGMSAPAVLAVLLMFTRRKENTLLKILFVICVIMCLLPVFAKILNGMSYYANRWCWGFSLLCCFILTTMWDRLICIAVREQKILFICVTVLLGLCMVLRESRTVSAFLSIGIIYALLFMICIFSANGKKDIIEKLICITVGICAICLSFWYNSSSGLDWGSKAITVEQARDELYTNESEALSGLAESDITRYSSRYGTYNINVLTGISSTGMYWSITNPYVNRFRDDMMMRESLDIQYEGYDERASLLSTAAVDYFTDYSWDYRLTPYGFEHLGHYDVGWQKTDRILSMLRDEMGTDELPEEQTSIIAAARYNPIAVYKNTYALPIGYTYDSYFTGDLWEKLSPVQKQELMLDSVYLSEDVQGIEKVEESEGVPDYYIDYEIEPEDMQISVIDNKIAATSTDKSITLNFEGKPGCETYIEIDGLDIDETTFYDLYFGDDERDPYRLYNRATWELLDDSDKADYKLWSTWEKAIEIELMFNASSGTSKVMLCRTPSYPSYSGRHDFIINMGYSEKPVTSVKITFPIKGVYSFDSIKVACVPYDSYGEKISQLAQESLENIQYGTDTLTGTISAGSDKILCIAIPYSEGWKASIDNEEVPVMIANGRYLGITVPEGTHNIELHYTRPWQKAGLILSILGICAFVSEIIISCRRKRKSIEVSD